MKVTFDQVRTTHMQQNHALKQLVTFKTIIVVQENKVFEPVRVHWYSSKGYGSKIVYCLVRIRGHGVSLDGSGKAGGGGYCKYSTSFENALMFAGVSIDKQVGGTGYDAVDRAIEAIVLRLGYKGGNNTIVSS